MPKEYDRLIDAWLVAIGAYLCVAGLIAVLAFTLQWAWSRSLMRPRKERPGVARSLGHLRRLRGERRPSGEFALFVRSHLQDARVLICPTVEEHMRHGYWPARDAPEDDMAYCYISGLSQRDPEGWVVAFDEEWNHVREGVNVLHVGGHVQWVTDAEEPARTVAVQSRALRRRGWRLSIVRPWWSLGADPPPFVVLPPEDKASKTPVGRIVLGAMCLAGGALWLSRIARAPRPGGGTPAAETSAITKGFTTEARTSKRRRV